MAPQNTELHHKQPRRHPRATLDVQVKWEKGGEEGSGQTANVSQGGLLVETSHPFDPDTEVVVRFTLPDGARIEALGTVRHRKAGGQTGLMFVELGQDAQRAIARHVSGVRPYVRRSPRIPRRVAIVLKWRDLQGDDHEESASTLMVSRHGGLAACATRFKPGQDGFLWWPEKNRGSQIRMVFRQLGRLGDLAEIGFEFKDSDNFWQIEFPAETSFWENTRSSH
jgi:hypothetical protein